MKGDDFMAGNLSTRSGSYNTSVCSFYVDREAEIAQLPTTTKKASGTFADNPDFDVFPALRSTCIVGNYGGETEVYILTSSGWKKM